jgi:hypothetical protein
MRTFETGATRDSDDGKLDYDGFLSPLALERFAQYMHKHRLQADGKLRDSDNWKKGIPIQQYLKSKWRHFVDVWKQLHGLPGADTLEDSLCADLFNTQGLLHEVVKARLATEQQQAENELPSSPPLPGSRCADCARWAGSIYNSCLPGNSNTYPECFTPKETPDA